jgi:DNA adenine methylase
MKRQRVPSLFNWAGSKARVAKALCDLKFSRFENYHEPFMGSGAAFFGLSSRGFIAKSQLSDVNPRLVNVFKAVQSRPNDVIQGLRSHALLDSDVHFSAALGRLNARQEVSSVDAQLASDVIYLLSQSFHSAWYETLDGSISMSRRRDSGLYRARYQDLTIAASLMQASTVSVKDFRDALQLVVAGDLVFLDPPYLYADDSTDPHAYNANRFSKLDLQHLSVEMKRLVSLGAHVIFCWGLREDAIVPKAGNWIKVGRDNVWLSEALADNERVTNAALGRG